MSPKANQGTANQSRRNQWTGFYMIGTSVIKELKHFLSVLGLNPLQPDVAFLYPLKTSENLKVF